MATQGTRSYSNSNGIHRNSNSISSAGSGKSTRGSRSGVESAVTRLLIAIRQLLESLTHWSQGTVTEEQVSDVYVRLGNDFNLAVAAFTSCNIDMNDLMSVPGDLRTVLESCLAEDPSPTTLEQYLTQVRAIITNLLQGLRIKQSQYRRLTDRRSSRKGESAGESDDLKSLKRGSSGAASQAGREERRSATPELPVPRGSVPPSAPPPFPPPSIDVSSESPPRSRMGESSTPSPRLGSSSLRMASEPGNESSSSMGDDSLRRGKSMPISRVASDAPVIPPLPVSTPPPLSPSLVPPNVKRYSLSDSGVLPAPPPVLVQQSTGGDLSRISEADTEAADASQDQLLEVSAAPEVANSLRALKKSDTLERRASKRFSTYNFQKMTGSRAPGGGPGHSRRSVIAGSGTLSPGDLQTLAEEEEVSPTRGVYRVPSRSKSIERRGKAGPSPINTGVPPVPSRPSADFTGSHNHEQSIDGLPSAVAPAIPGVQPPTPSLSVFLQVGREVKKTTFEGSITIPALRVLFMDKFSYNPGQDNFPAIYIRDPSSGVQYELEDVDEIKDKCLLSLNIEPLDQIKQHIDLQMANLARELKDIKTSMSSSQRLSMHSMAPTLALQSPISPPARPTDKQFRDAARRLSRIASDDSPKMAPLQPQNTGATDVRIVTDLRTQFDEVQNLRRDIGVMRQLYNGFMTETKESLGGLRTQAQSLRQAANSKVGGGRAFIDSGKPKLDARSQDVLTKVEEFQDAIENLKDDVVKRHVSPKRHVMKNLKGDMDSITAELESLQEHVKNVKPMWKKTWEEELQNIVEEQQFLVHQEELLEDLIQDLKATSEVYSHLDKIITMRGATPAPSGRGLRSFKPSEETGDLNTVMLQIKGNPMDTERRLKAIEQNQKQREKEKASKSDDFEAELSGFVKGNKLRMTGGADEIERVRAKKSEATIKAMFTGDSQF